MEIKTSGDQKHFFNIILYTSVAAGPPCGAVRGASSLCHCMAGDPPPLRPGVGDVTLPFLRSMADFYCGVAAIRDRWFIIWKGASPPPSHRGSPLRGRLSAAACAPYSAGGMDLRRGGDVVRVCLRLRYVAAQRGTSATPWRSGYGDTSSPRSSKLGLAPTANSPGPGSQTSLFPVLYVTVVAFKKAWIS
jgi:hypothetical protein